MKTRMKKLISIKSMPLFALALLIVLGSTLAETGHEPVSGSGSALLNLTTGAAVGQADLIIGDTVLSAEVYVQLTSQVVSEDGVLHATATHTFVFSRGKNKKPIDTFTTTDKGIVEFATGTLNEHLTITEGTGGFEGVGGELSVHGQVQFLDPPMAYVSYDISGAICR